MSEKKTQVRTALGRIAFTRYLFNKSDKNKYTCAIVFEADQDISNLKQLAKTEAESYFKGSIPKNAKNPIKLKEDMDEGYEYLEGKVVVNVSTGFPIPVIGSDNHPITEEDIKAGDYVQMVVSAYGFDVDGNKGVGFNVIAVKKYKDGDAFNPRQDVSNLFNDGGSSAPSKKETKDDWGF